MGNGQSRPGFTLLEAVLASFIFAFIMAALMSVFRLAGGAVSASAGMTFPQSGEVLDQVATDVSLAQGFTERTASAITLTVPDRTGDGQPETIRYSWSGVSGAPLLRQVNGGAAVAIASDVRHFNLGYLTRTVKPDATGGGGGGGSEGAEQLLMEHDDKPGGSMVASNIKLLCWCAQYFKPTLPGNATAWSVTRVAFRARKESNPHGTIVVQLREATSGNLPSLTTIAATEISEQALGPQFNWVTLNLPGAVNLDPAKGYCLVIKYGNGSGTIGSVEYENGGNPMTANAHFLTTSLGGLSWSAPNNTQDMRFRIHGTVTTP
jgi:hypothetical protein